MVGALMYLAMGYPEKMGDPNKMTSENYAYIIGLLLPDIVKSGFIKTKEDFDKLFEKCEEKDILTYEQFIEYSKDPHFTGNIKYTANPNLRKYVESKYVNLRNPLWQGVFCHLIGDKMIYDKDFCINKSQIKADFKAEELNDEQWENSKTAKLIYGEEGDYNILNHIIQDEFHVLEYLTPELREQFQIGFSKSEKSPKYINWDHIRMCIYRARLIARSVDDENEKEVVKYFEKLEEADALRKGKTTEVRE